MKRVQRNKLKSDQFTMISDDCWGAEVYKAFDLPYLTPFIGTWISPEDFVELLKNLKSTIESELTFKDSDLKYPLGLLNGRIEIHFMHENDETTAKTKWDRRKERIVWDNIFVKLDAVQAEEQDVLSFLNLPIPHSICFINKETKEKYGFKECHSTLVSVPCWEVDGRNMFTASLDAFDLVKWLNKEGNFQYTEGIKEERTQHRLNYNFLDALESFDRSTFKDSENMTTSYEDELDLVTAHYNGKGLGKSFTYSLEKTETYGIFRTKKSLSVYVLASSPNSSELIMGLFEGKGNLTLSKDNAYYTLDQELSWYQFKFELEDVNDNDKTAIITGIEFIINPKKTEAGTIELKAIFIGEEEQLEITLQQ